MKIIGESQDGFILSASKDEVSQLIGYYWYGKDSCDRLLKVGKEINISGMFQRLYDLSKMSEELKKVQDTLNRCSGLLSVVEPLIQIIGDKKKEE